MTDVEINYLCACAYFSDGMRFISIVNGSVFVEPEGMVDAIKYEPLHEDSQAMALVKKFRLNIHWPTGLIEGPLAVVTEQNNNYKTRAHSLDLNRAICLCVANMQAGKGK